MAVNIFSFSFSSFLRRLQCWQFVFLHTNNCAANSQKWQQVRRTWFRAIKLRQRKEKKKSSTIIGDDKTVCQFRLNGNVCHPSSDFRISEFHTPNHILLLTFHNSSFNCAPKQFQLMTQKCNSIIHFNAHNQTHSEQWTANKVMNEEMSLISWFTFFVENQLFIIWNLIQFSSFQRSLIACQAML